MAARSTASSYGWLAQWLHWLIAGLVVTQFVLGWLAQAAADESLPVRQLALLANHKSVGITVLVLAIIRICWRWGTTVPELPRTMSRWQVQASRAAHWLLYLLIFALPISGWLMSSASAYTVSWFNLIELPDMVSADETLKERLVSLHHLLATVLFTVAVVHLLAALKHRFLDHDDVLGRMLSRAGGALFVTVVVGALWAATNVGGSGQASPTAIDPTAPIPAPPAPIRSSADVAPWQIDYASSYIRFSAEQAGASFDGQWPDWQADIRFSADSYATSSAMVTVEVASVSTGDSERDETLLAQTWFSSSAFPTASFITDAFNTNEDGTFTATGQLTIKGLTTPVQLHFSVAKESGEVRILNGSSRLDRLALQLGTGEWADPTWVGQFVNVSVHVETVAQP